MSSIPYHQAREIIESRIGEYTGQFDGIQLPAVSIERNGQDTSVKFHVGKDADLYKIMGTLVTSIGEMKISQLYAGSTYMRYDNSRIIIDKSFSNYVQLQKEGDLTSQEIEALIETYKIGNLMKPKSSPKEKLNEYGVTIYDSNQDFNWDYIAGYDDVKQEIKDTVLLPLQHPEVYERIARRTRKKYENVRPKAVLFEGPPGTGKTTSARIISSETDIPMIYVPVESIMTKWYGESEKNLSGIFEACNDLESAIIFLDEIDSLATSRERGLHEATRRVLSVLLRKIDGFEPNNRAIMIGATNRKEDLDPALISRFDASVYFHLPNLEERIAIFGNYAQHLSTNELERIGQESEGVSGRNIKDICEQSERKWASKILRKEELVEIPPLAEYLKSLKSRKDNGI